MISKETEIWFVHLGFEPPLPLKIKRINDLGARVIGIKRLDLNWTPPDETTLDQKIEAGFYVRRP